MTTSSEGVAVIATQLARTDRRALSQAWYSALHLAQVPSAAPATMRAPARTPAAPAESRRAARAAFAQAAPGAPGARAPRRAAAAAMPMLEERRRPPCATARRIEGAVASLRARINGDAAQTVDVAGGRVRLIVRSDRGTTRIVALCSPPLREPVERALASARFALAGAGIRVGAS